MGGPLNRNSPIEYHTLQRSKAGSHTIPTLPTCIRRIACAGKIYSPRRHSALSHLPQIPYPNDATARRGGRERLTGAHHMAKINVDIFPSRYPAHGIVGDGGRIRTQDVGAGGAEMNPSADVYSLRSQLPYLSFQATPPETGT